MRALTLSLLLLALAAPAAGQPAYKRGTLAIVQDGRRHRLEVEVADTVLTRQQGLMFRTALPENAGMLFVFEDEARWSFWMKNTLIPLSIAWINSHWRIVDIQDMEVVPEGATETPIYAPRAAAKYALEVNKGYFARRGITTGARVEYTPAR